MKSPKAMRDGLLAWIRASTPENLGILVPVSGGSDSALVFWLYNHLFRNRTVGIFFGQTMRSEEWFASIGEVRKAPTRDMEDREVSRWSECLRISLAENRILVGTRNRTEHELGVYSQASRVAQHLPIAGVWKTDVLALGTLIGVPEEILASSREADIDCGRPEAYARIPLEHVDIIAKELIGEGEGDSTSIDAGHRDYITGLFSRNRFKAELPCLGPLT